MKNKNLKRLCAILLVLAFLFGFIGNTIGVQTSALETSNAQAAVTNERFKTTEDLVASLQEDLKTLDCLVLKHVDNNAFAKAGHIARLKTEEDLDTYVFENTDGSKTVYYMGKEVKYIAEDRSVKEKDITLVPTKNGYQTKQNNVGVELPSVPANGIKVKYDNYDLSIVPLSSSRLTSTVLSGNAVTYTDYFGDGKHLKYTPTLSGLKEDIILDSYDHDNNFEFLFNTDGLYLVEKDGEYLLRERDGLVKMYLGSILVYDAMGKPDIGFMKVEAIEEGSKYKLTVGAREEFLTAADTVYPVTIDPTITVSDSTHGANSIQDAPIFQNKASSNFGAYTYNRVGYAGSDYGVARTVVRLNGLINNADYMTASADGIQSVYFHVKESSGNSSVTVGIYPLTTNTTWTETGIKWNNVGSWGNIIVSQSLTSNSWASFNITSLAKAWKNGTYNPNAGFIMISNNESSINKSFCSSEFTTTANVPYVVATYTSGGGTINYTDITLTEGQTRTLSVSGVTGTPVWTSTDPSVASVDSNGLVTAKRAGIASIVAAIPGYAAKMCFVQVKIADGIYSIKNAASQYILGVPDGGFFDMSNVILCGYDSSEPHRYKQLWKIKYLDDGYYSIRPVYKYDMGLDITDGNVDVYGIGTTDTIAGVPNYARWKIKYVTNGYVFENARDGSVIAPAGNGTALATSVVSATYSSTTVAQRWTLTAKTVPNKLMLFRKYDASYETDARRGVATGTTKELEDLDIDVVFISNNDISQDYIISSSNSSILRVNTNGTLTGISNGSVTITITKTSGAVTYNKTMTIVVSPIAISGCEIEYDPNTWNNNTNYLQRNCYAYALNCKDKNLQPGYSDDGLADYYTSKEELIEAIAKDAANEGFGLIPIPIDEVTSAICPSGMYKVALVYQSEGNKDYHWYRQNPDGTWSHKMPGIAVKNVDTSNQTIYDPQECNRNYTAYGKEYDVFLGYYAVYPLSTS